MDIMLFFGIAVFGLSIAFFDGLTRGLSVINGALLVLAYPFFEAQYLDGSLPWTIAIAGQPGVVRAEAVIGIALLLLVPYAVVRLLFAIARRGGI
ncbi:MAG: hypothetical protein AAF732_00285 [Pseudomonadota bacterium]